jgi:hypothetical protein
MTLGKCRLTVAALILLMIVVGLSETQISFGDSSPNSSETSSSDFPYIAMTEEWVNYTIGSINGTLWATIDGFYPIHLSSEESILPMVYPIPPNTTNIYIWLNGAELPWLNYAEINPTAKHYTVIGDWEMVYCVLNLTSTDFLLQIQYQHPIQLINGSYEFLYDLNISPYLTPENPKSTAHFTIKLPQNVSTNVYRTVEWNSVKVNSSFMTATNLVTFDVISEYNKPLAGDIAFILAGSTVPELSEWICLPFLIVIAIAVLAFRVKSKKATNK